jgi:hypothetical protein
MLPGLSSVGAATDTDAVPSTISTQGCHKECGNFTKMHEGQQLEDQKFCATSNFLGGKMIAPWIPFDAVSGLKVSGNCMEN